ncbi:MAG: hypothetical protein JSS63_11545 [Bacteroidetes bacterium]|nr:hypothetical protein [Bacteroidota bacterium]
MIIAVKCPSCNANLEIPDDVEFINCEYCGTSIKVREIVRVETDYDVPEWIKIADNAYKGKNYDEAYEYYNMILEKESYRSNAWIGKGLAAGRLSDNYEPRFEEMNQLVKYGISISDEKKKNGELSNAKREILSMLQDYYKNIKTDVFNSANEFDEYINSCKPFIEACGNSYQNFFTNDLIFIKFYSTALRSLVQKNFINSAETRKTIEIKDPLRREYRNKLRELEKEIKINDSKYVTFDEFERKTKIAKLLISGAGVVVLIFLIITGVNYFTKIASQNKSKATQEDSVTNSKQTEAGYEIINKSLKNKKIIYTIYTETDNLSDIQKYADALIERDKKQFELITLYFLSDKNEANDLGGRDIQLKNSNKNMPNSFSARVKYTKGKTAKELSYYEKNKLISESY